MTKITWQGHACFYIESATGLRIVTDPYTPGIAGLKPLREPADAVVMSSDNDTFHSDGAGAPGHPVIVNALAVAREGGSREVKGLTVRAIEAMESVVHKAHPDQNAMYRFDVDGVSIGHMGDVGNPLSPAQIGFFRGVDVLLALTGGPPTIELDDLDRVIREVQPRIVIPMHYRLPGLTLKILGLEAFITRYPADQVVVHDCCALEVTRSNLPETTRIAVLQARANDTKNSMHNLKMYIRRLRGGDSELLAATMRAAIAEEEWRESTMDLTFLEQALCNDSCYYFTCLIDSMPVGYLCAYRFPDAPGGVYHVFLQSVDIAERWRRHGIGTALVEGLKRECVADGVDHIWVGTSIDNVAAQRLYVKTGGKHIETGMEYVYELEEAT